MTGITISEEQLKYAQQKVRREPLATSVEGVAEGVLVRREHLATSVYGEKRTPSH